MVDNWLLNQKNKVINCIILDLILKSEPGIFDLLIGYPSRDKFMASDPI